MEKEIFPLSMLTYFNSVSPPLFHTISQCPNYLVVCSPMIFQFPCRKKGVVKLKLSRQVSNRLNHYFLIQ